MTPLDTPLDRELLRNFAKQRSVESFQTFVERYLGLVYSAALRQAGNDADAAEVTRAVFLAFARAAPKLRRKTVLAAWFLRASRVAARKVLRLRKKRRSDAALEPPPVLAEPHPDWSPISPFLDQSLDKIRPKYRNPVLLAHCLNWPSHAAAAVLRVSERRFEKRRARGLAKLSRRLGKRNVAPSENALAALLAAKACATPVPSPLHNEILAEAPECFGRQPKLELARAVLRSFTWAKWKRRFKFVATGLGGVACVAGIVALTATILWRTGRLLPLLIEFGSRMQARNNPELAQPAHAWSGDPARPRPTPDSVRTSADLYSVTNIWQVQLRFTPEHWEGLLPKRIPPVRKIMQDDGTLDLRNPKARRSGLAGALGMDFQWVQTDFELNGEWVTNSGARFRGNGTYLDSLYGSKRSFKVDVGKFVKHRTFAGVHVIDFANLITDRSYMSDALGYRLFRDAGVPAPRTGYAWMRTTVDGKWDQKPLGLYLVLENLDADFASDRFGTKKAAILKPVTYDLFKDLGGDWAAYNPIYDPKTKISHAHEERIIDFSRLLTHGSDAEFAQHAGNFLDLDEFARFLAGLVLLSSYDSFLSDGQNFYIYIDPRTDKIGFIPWDLDHAWGGFPFIGTEAAREEASIWHPWTSRNRLLERLMKMEEFKSIYRKRLDDMLTKLFVPERLFAQIDELAPILRTAIAAESNFRLVRFDQAVSTNWLSGPRDGGGGPTRPVHQLKRFISNRAKSVRSQLEGKSHGVDLRGAKFNEH